MWSDNDIDNAFRRLDPAEPDPTPFPLDAWLKLEAGLDQAVIDRAVRRRLWQFFAAEVAVVALVGLGWSLWPAGDMKSTGSEAKTVASATLPSGKAADTKRQQNSAASVAPQAAPAAPHIAQHLTPAMPRPATMPSASATEAATAAAASPADGATGSGQHLPLAAVGTSAPHFHSGNAQVALLDKGATVATRPIFGQLENASPFQTAGRKAEGHSLAGRAAIAKSSAGKTIGTSAKTIVRSESSIIGAEGPGKADGGRTVAPSRATSEVAIAGAASLGGRREAALPAATATSEQNARAVATNPDENTETASTTTGPTNAAGANLAPAPTTAVALAQPAVAALPSLLAPAELTPDPLPAVVRQPRLYVGVVVAPDVSTVRFATVQAPHLNVGLTLEYQLGQRWRLATGVQRATKTYDARREDYDWTNYPKTQARDFSWVEGQCTVIDVPLNLRYDAVVQAHARWFGTAGLSSFFMHRENYSYDYLEGGTYKNWELPGLVNANQHFFSVLNLSAGYEYGLGTHWRLQAEPYVKVPLAGVGAGQVKLLSAGVYFGLKYGF